MNSFNSLKRQAEGISGVRFKNKDFRSSAASIMVDLDPKLLPAVSAQLRHKEMSTTQRSYVRVDRGIAAKQLESAWNGRPSLKREDEGKMIIPPSPSQANSAKKAVIRRDFGITGYG